MTAVSAEAKGGPVSIGGRSHHPLFAIATVMVMTFLAAFDSRLLNVGLSDLRGGFSLGFDEGAWLATAALAPQIFVAPAVAWLATVFGIRRLFAVPSLIYALVSLSIPLVRNYELLLQLHIVRGLLLGVFVPASLIIIFRNSPMPWWLPTIATYAFRAAFTLNAGVALGGHYVKAIGWQWLYWQDVLKAPLMALFACLGASCERLNRALVMRADWGGMLLFGSGLALIYIGLDQGSPLDRLESGIVVASLLAGGLLLLCFWVNELLRDEPWASAAVLRSRNLGLMLLVTIGFTLTSVSYSTLVAYSDRHRAASVGADRTAAAGLLRLAARPSDVRHGLPVAAARCSDHRRLRAARICIGRSDSDLAHSHLAAAGLRAGRPAPSHWSQPDFPADHHNCIG